MTGVPVPVISGAYTCPEFQLLSSESKYLSPEGTIYLLDIISTLHQTQYLSQVVSTSLASRR